MGCNCCRMIKSYIYDPSVPVDVHGRKRDLPGSSLYIPHLQEPEDGDRLQKKQGFYNLGYSNSGSPNPSGADDGNTKLDIENNHINRLHGSGPPGADHDANPEWTDDRKVGGGGTDPDLRGTPTQHTEQPTLRYAPPLPSVPPIYQLPSSDGPPRPWDRELLSGSAVTRIQPYIFPDGLDDVDGYKRKDGDDDDDDEDERESGVGSTPDYLGDTGDEASVLSGDINTSSTSLSSADTRPGTEDDKRGRREADGREDREDCQSVTDSMVAEALAALEAATAGEDYD